MRWRCDGVAVESARTGGRSAGGDDATAPADSGAGWSAPAPTSSPMSPVSEPPKTSRMGKILLIVLIVVVVALVILAVVWFFLNRGSDSSASALGSVPTWTSLIG